MRKKKSEQQDSAPGGRVTPAEVQQIEFRLAFRGYNERDVDAFLDKVTEDLAWYLEEIERLGSAPAPAAAGAGMGAAAMGVAEAEAEAAAILERARGEADEIVRAAERRAAAASASAGAPPGDARAAVAPFLNAEREFLQQLGGLVQGHAEEIKQMVLALRARADLPPGPDAVENGAGGRSQPSTVPADAASAAEIRERLGEPEPEAEAKPEPERVIDLATEPAYSSEAAPAGEGRERSLRELFWGDD
jgi:DivIVA domain-containing protein